MRIEEEQLAETLKQPGYSVRGAGLSNLKNNGQQQKSANKYRAQRTEYMGRIYPSNHHAEIALYLNAMTKLYDGIIEEVPFRLPGKTNTGRPFIHRVDFGCLKDGKVVRWVEAKGKDLELGKLKRRQVEEIFKIVIEIV